MTEYLRDKSMVTILNVDVDENLVREGIQMALGVRLQGVIKALESEANELAVGNLLERKDFNAAFARLARFHEEATPLLEYARAYLDQWPDTPDEEAPGENES